MVEKMHAVYVWLYVRLGCKTLSFLYLFLSETPFLQDRMKEKRKEETRNMKLKEFALKKPVLFSVLIMILSIGVTFLPLNSFLFGNLNEQAAEYASGFLEQTLVSVLLMMLLAKFDWLRPAGFGCKAKQLFVAWPMFLILILNLLELVDGTLQIDTSEVTTIIFYVLVYLSTGLFEETLCRGVVQTLFLKKWGKTRKGIYFSVILSSILFGMFHLVHFFLGHMTLLASVVQVIYATFIGVFMGACVLRNQSIIPMIIVHGLVDITGSLNEIAVHGGIPKGVMTISPADAMISIVLMLPLFLYGLFILRKQKEFGGD